VAASSTQEPPTDAPVVRRRWRLFLVVESVLLAVLVVGVWSTLRWPVYPQVQALLIGVLGSWLCFSLPVAVLYLLGRPPEMTLTPFWPSPQEQAYRQEVGGRPVLTDEEFYTRFYEGSGIPREIPTGIRRCLANMGLFIDRAYPDDMIGYAFDDLDYADVLKRVGREFGIRFTKQEYPLFTGTLENLIEQVHRRLNERG
jgi:hypothetical protein